MDRIAIFLLLSFLAPCAHADVFYLCDSGRDNISITDDSYATMEPVAAQAERVSASDVSDDKEIVRRCRLSSGIYVVTFALLSIEGQPVRVDDGHRRVSITIRHAADAVLPLAVMGRCDIPRSENAVCTDAWAVEVRLSGRTGAVRLLHLVYR